eukprot:6381240-Prymnesium_polylepis.2
MSRVMVLSPAARLHHGCLWAGNTADGGVVAVCDVAAGRQYLLALRLVPVVGARLTEDGADLRGEPRPCIAR